MSRHALTVSVRFLVRGGGLTLFPQRDQLDHGLGIGDSIELRRPDGSVARAKVERLDPVHTNPKPFLALVLTGWATADVPEGTEVWVVSPP